MSSFMQRENEVKISFFYLLKTNEKIMGIGNKIFHR